MVSSGVVAAIHVAGVRCDPCGAMQRIASQGSQRVLCVGGVNKQSKDGDLYLPMQNELAILVLILYTLMA